MKKVINFLKKIILRIISFLKKIFKNISYNIKKINMKNKDNKIKTFFTKTFGLIGSSISSLIKRDKKEKEIDISKELKKINKNILNIEKTIENETTPIVLKMYKKEVNKKINKLKNIKNLRTREESKLIKDQTNTLLNIKDKITICENKLKGLDYNNVKKYKINKTKTIKKSNIKQSKKTNNIKNKIKKNLSLLTIPGVLVINNIRKPKKVLIKKENKTDKIMIENIKKMNKEINNAYLNMQKIRNNNNSDKEEELNLLKEKVNNLKKEYLELSKNDEFKDLKKYKNINSIDPNHLVYHDRSIEDLVEYLENSINDLKIKKVKEEKIKKQKQEIIIDKSQIELVKNSIKKDIMLSKEEIEKIKQDINKLGNNYKPTLLERLNNFFRLSINVGISLIPFGIFKNKLLATLTSGIILNNRIRSMNSIFNNEQINMIEYEGILNEIKDKDSCLKSTNYILLDTIDEIDKLKGKLELLYFDQEAKKLLIGLEEMKLDLLEENVKVETMLEDINGLNVNKVKKKVA